jgi:glycogen operon protein
MQIGNDAPDGLRLLIRANAGEAALDFRLALAIGGPWTPHFDTTSADGRPVGQGAVWRGGSVRLPGRAFPVLARDLASPRGRPLEAAV